MSNTYINNYKRKYYNQKIWGIYVTAWALVAQTVLLVITIMSTGDLSLTDFGYGFWFGCMALIVGLSVYLANRTRLKRFRDDIIGKRIVRSDDEFWSIASSKSIVWLIVLEILLFILTFVCGRSGASEIVIVVLLLLMLSVLIIKLKYNRNLKDLRINESYLQINGIEESIYWTREIVIEVVFGLILESLMVSCFATTATYYASKKWSIPKGNIWLLVIFTVVLFVVAAIRIQRLVNMKNEEIVAKRVAEQAKPKTLIATPSATQSKVLNSEEENPQELLEVEQVTYENCASFSALCRDFVNYADKRGVRIDEGSAREVLAAMAASRAVWLKSNDENYTRRVAEMLCEYFMGTRMTLELFADAFSEQDLAQCPIRKGEEKSTLAQYLYIAKQYTNSVNVLAINNAHLENFEEVFAPFIQSFRAPEGDNRIKLSYANSTGYYRYAQNGDIAIPANVWCIFIGKETDKVGKKRGEYMFEVTLKNGGESAQRLGEEKESFLSYARYIELLNEAVAEHFLPLDLWKKFDKIEEYLQAKIPFEITNPLARQMEQYSSVSLACGAEMNEVVDKVLRNCILRLLDGRKREELDQEGSTFAELLDGLFGMDNLPLTQKALSDRNLG